MISHRGAIAGGPQGCVNLNRLEAVVFTPHPNQPHGIWVHLYQSLIQIKKQPVTSVNGQECVSQLKAEQKEGLPLRR